MLVITHKSTVVRGVQRFFTTESAEHAEKDQFFLSLRPLWALW
jgi:phosphatidate phosphatase APP1